jgi:inhibitor of KinA sporulation pathway (predicted exonuclease)
MPSKFDKIIVVDIEATCYDKGTEPPGFVSEIIEVGVCLLDVATLERSDKQSIYVKPTRSVVSPFCTQLTGITQAVVDQGVPLAEACKILMRDYLSKARVWASYGDYDRRMFTDNCKMLDIKYPFGAAHQNVRTRLTTDMGLVARPPLDDAVRLIGRPFEGTHHCGADDAWNVAAVLGRMMLWSRNGKALEASMGKRVDQFLVGLANPQPTGGES